MKFRLIVYFILINSSFVFSQQVEIPKYYKTDKSLNDSLKQIIKDVALDGTYDVGKKGIEQVSFAVIDLNGDEPVLAG
ncbi:MAG: hypothetical protein ABI550_08085 [Ignavibacteriaceae bacterium]